MSNTSPSRGEFIRRIAVSGILRVGQALLALAITVLMARALGPDGYGRYAFALSAASLIAIAAQMGLPTLLVREVARFQLIGDWGAMKGLLRRANQAVLVLASLLAVVGAVAVALCFGRIETAGFAPFAWALLLIPLVSLGNLRAATLRGLQHVVQGQLPETLAQPLALLVFVAMAATLGALTPTSAMALHVLAAATAFAVGVVLLMRTLPPEVRTATPAYDTAAWMKSMLPLSLTAGLQMVNHQADILLLGLLASSEDVGVYRVAAQCAAIVAFALATINLVIAPQLSRLYYDRSMARLQGTVTVASRAALAVGLPLALLFMFFGGAMLRQGFGPEYAEGHAALAILCLGQLVNAFLGPVANLLNMTGHEGVTTRATALAATLNCLLNLALIPTMGIEGAAIATAASLAVWNVVLHRQAMRRTGINSAAFAFRARRATEIPGPRS